MFQVLEVIAKGAFGNVLRVQRGADKIAYAMKVAVVFIDLTKSGFTIKMVPTQKNLICSSTI